MGAVCSAGMVEGNAEIGGKTLGKLMKENSFSNNRKEKISDSRSNNGQGKKHRNQETGLGLSTSASVAEKQVRSTLLFTLIGSS